MPPGDRRSSISSTPDHPKLDFATPSVTDGTRMWQLAKESKTLDVNSRYSYLLWCRDFAQTSVIALDAETPAGFITGYRRAEVPNTLFIWQVAVSSDYRRQGLARRMLDHLTASGPRYVEATVTPDNIASTRLFESFATANNAELTREELFTEAMLGNGHEPEILFRIGPLTGLN